MSKVPCSPRPPGRYAISGGTGGTGVPYVHGATCHRCHLCPGWGDGHGTDQAAATARADPNDLSFPSSVCQECGAFNRVLMVHLPVSQQEQVQEALATGQVWVSLAGTGGH